MYEDNVTQNVATGPIRDLTALIRASSSLWVPRCTVSTHYLAS